MSHFDFHKGSVTSVEWCPHEGSMLASTGADNQLAVRVCDLGSPICDSSSLAWPSLVNSS